MTSEELNAVWALTDRIAVLRKQERIYQAALKEIERLVRRLQDTNGYRESQPDLWLAQPLWEITETCALAKKEVERQVSPD